MALRAHDLRAPTAGLHGGRYRAVVSTENRRPPGGRILRVDLGAMRRILRIAGWHGVRYRVAVFTGNSRPLSSSFLRVALGPMRRILRIAPWPTVRYGAAWSGMPGRSGAVSCGSPPD